MRLEPYLSFEGRCEEAIEFYRSALGAEITVLMRFSDAPQSPEAGTCPPNSSDKVMHASLRIGENTVMVSDGRCAGAASFQGFNLTLTARDDDEAERLFAAVGKGGQVQVPLAKTFFSSRFGMLADRFGVAWMVIVAP